MSKLFLLLLLIPVLLTVDVEAQAIELRNGEVVIGRVTKVGEQTVDVEVGFPTTATRTLKKSDLMPVSLYMILAARSEPSAEAHLSLGDTARVLGLRGHAIAEYRVAALMNPALRSSAEAKVAELRIEIARELLDDAKEAIGEVRFTAARLALSEIERGYGDTPVAREAVTLLRKVKDTEIKNASLRRVSAAQLEAILNQVATHLQRADAVKGAQSVHGGTKTQRALEQVVQHLEAAAGVMKDVAPTDDSPPALADRLGSARENVRRRLVEAYLALGTVFIQRRAFGSADKYCEKACELDPGNELTHRLHSLILQAKITSGLGLGSGY